MELQSRRLMGLQLLDLKSRSPAPPSPIGVPFSPSRAVGSPTIESPPDSGEQHGNGTSFPVSQRKIVNRGGGDKDESAGEASPNADSDQSVEHNLPDSPFASPTKKSSSAFAQDPFAPSAPKSAATSSAASTGCSASYVVGANNGGSLANHHIRPSALDIPSPKAYFFPMSRLSSDHGAGAIGM